MKNITAILATSGISSRFRPLSDHYHKTLFKVGGQALIRRTLEGLIKNGIKDIVITHAPGDKERFMEAAKGFSARINYVLLDTPLSTGIVLKIGLPHVPKDRDIIMVNGGQLKTADHLKKILRTKAPANHLKILSAESDRPWEYAVLKFGAKNEILEVIEKPEKGSEPSNMRTAGIYFAPAKFREYILSEPESPYSLINAFNRYIKDFGGTAVRLDEKPTSIKYAFDLLDVISEFAGNLKRKISKKARVAKNVILNGVVVIEDGVEIKENVVIYGPAFIGRNCRIGANSVIREGSVLEPEVHLGVGTEVKHSYIGEGTHIHSGYIGDSIIAENCRIGAGFIAANRRLDRKNIKFTVKGNVVDSQKSYLGCIVGANTKMGIRVSTMPGTIIGANCIIGSNTEVKGAIDSGKTVYTKTEIIIK